MGPIVEKATEADLDAIEGILRASFSSPWTRAMMREELERPVALVWVLRPGPGEPAAAFLDCWLVADELHVLNLATHPAHRRRGHGRRLMREALDLARERSLQCVTLELRASNEPARRLYADLGFVPIGTRPGYYADTGEDAIVMMWNEERE
ncbi:MAG: ribosomal protein S18-alanine N-acetyltransferase [Myxococcota bacterium]